MAEKDKFENKPLAGLAALRGMLPAGPKPVEQSPPERAEPERGSDLGEKLVVQREKKKRGGKTVTRVRGLELDRESCVKLAREMAKALGCGSSVEDGEILLQGSQVSRAATWLRERGAARVIEGN